MGDLTIDELAREAGLTVRNIRSYQTRGLLPGPEMRARTGYYSQDHLARLALIKQLQDDGLSLRLVERILAQRAEDANHMVALRRTVLTPLESEAETIDFEELSRRFGEFDEELLQQAMKLGAIIPQENGTLLVPQPELLQIAEDVTAQGISLKAALKVALDVRRNTADVSRSFVDMVLEEVWKPFDAAGRPDDQWPQIASTIDEVRPLANRIVLELLMPALSAEIDRVFGELLREQAEAD